MKITQVTLSGGATPTAIPCTVPAHLVRVTELNATPVGLVASFPEDEYVAQYALPKGQPVRKAGHGEYGILARPTGYNGRDQNGALVPAVSENYMKVKAADDSSSAKVQVTEYEIGEDVTL